MILKNIYSYTDLSGLNEDEMSQLCSEIRNLIIEVVSTNGGHIGSSLGTIEMTVALYSVYNLDRDIVIWDIGHQAYAHKILTGRKNSFNTLRKKGGISGFCSRSESKYDVFGAGHSSTSLAALLGITVANSLINHVKDDLKNPLQENINNENKISSSVNDITYDNVSNIAIIGDGALSAGMSFEALNMIPVISKSKNIIIINDNDVSISPSIGALRNHLTKLRQSHRFLPDQIQNIILGMKKKFSNHQIEKENIQTQNNLHNESYEKDIVYDGVDGYFSSLGYFYIGVVDGHNISDMKKLFCALKATNFNYNVIVHIQTEKGIGFEMPYASLKNAFASSLQQADDLSHNMKVNENNADNLHTHSFTNNYKIHSMSSKKITNENSQEYFYKYFGKFITQIMEQDHSIVCITPAMITGSGLSEAKNKFPSRVFDVAIAEQCAITFAAGMATTTIKPFCCIYSTFLQRGYDQLIHDVALQSLPVRFVIDRCGLANQDGVTHHGIYDIAFLRIIPNIILMAPSDEQELLQMLKTMQGIDHCPSVVRYPKYLSKINIHEQSKLVNLEDVEILEIGKSQIIQTGEKLCIISFGDVLYNVIQASKMLTDNKVVKPTIINARFAKPLDVDLIVMCAQLHEAIVVVENGCAGGFGSAVLEELSKAGCENRVATICYDYLPHELYNNHTNTLDTELLSVDNIYKICRKMIDVDEIKIT